MGHPVGVTAGVVVTGARLTDGCVGGGGGGGVTIVVRTTVIEVADALVVEVLVLDVLVEDVLVGTTMVVGASTETVVGFSLQPVSSPTIRTRTAPTRLVIGLQPRPDLEGGWGGPQPLHRQVGRRALAISRKFLKGGVPVANAPGVTGCPRFRSRSGFACPMAHDVVEAPGPAPAGPGSAER